MKPGDRDAAPSGQAALGGRVRRGLSLHHLLFIAFTLTGGLPIGILALWESQTAFEIERASTEDRQLLAARTRPPPCRAMSGTWRLASSWPSTVAPLRIRYRDWPTCWHHCA